MDIDPARLSIRRYPDPSLRRRAETIRTIDDSVRTVAARMIELMHEAEGVGLAAPQVGLAWRLFVTHTPGEDESERIYVNPVLSEYARTLESGEEGCLSLPGITVEVRRPSMVTITATDLDGREFSLTSNGLMARVWQHEFDHLEGRLIIDRMTPRDRLATRKQLRQLESEAVHG